MTILRSNSGMENPLVRRLQQHTQMTAIFHRNRYSARGDQYSVGGEPLVVGQSQPVAGGVQRVAVEETAVPAKPVLSPSASPSSAVPKDSVQTVSKPPTRSAVGTNTPPSPPVSSEERNWQRLQTIVQRHQADAVTDDTVAQPTQESGNPEQMQQKTAVSHLPTNKEGDIPSMQDAVAPETANFQPPSPTAAQSDTPHMKPVIESQTDTDGQQAPVVQREPVAQAATSAKPTLTPSSSSAAETTAKDSVPTVSSPTKPTAAIQTQIESDPAARTPAPKTAVHHDPASTKREMQPENTSPPLEAVWPVEVHQPVQRTPTSAKPLAKSAPVSAAETAVLQRKASQMQQLLADVPSGKPSDSKIEMVSPRRPRPTSSTPSKTVQTKKETAAPKATPPATAEPAAKDQPFNPPLVTTDVGPLPTDLWEIMGQAPPAGQTPPAADEPLAQPTEGTKAATAMRSATSNDPAMPPSKSFAAESVVTGEQQDAPEMGLPETAVPTITAPSQPIQRQAEMEPMQNQPDRARMITKPVAQILALPQAAAAPETIPVQAQLETTAVREKTNLPAMASSPASPQVMMQSEPIVGAETAVSASDLGRRSGQAVLQRSPAPESSSQVEQVLTEETAAQAEQTEVQLEKPEEAEQPAAEIDVDDLAHRVYSNIKRRMTIEWERVRRRS